MAELCVVARDFGARGWTPATSGNYSVRVDDSHFAVTRSGRDKRHLTAEDLMIVDLQCASDDGGTASAEAALHAQIYAADASVDCVLHVHSPAATVASRRLQAPAGIELAGYELLKAFEGIPTHEVTLTLPVLPNSQDMAELCASVRAIPDDAKALPAYLIAGHGAYTWGHDVASAARHMEALDFLLTCYLEELRYSP